MDFGSLKLERTKDMCKLKKEIIAYLFDFVSRKQYGTWWKYKGEFVYEGNTYLLESECKFDNQVFTYRNLHIEHKQVEVSVEQMVQAGLLQ